MYVDLGAEQLIAASRGPVRIAVEVKSFVGSSEIQDLETALGQYMLYGRVLGRDQPERTLWLAVPSRIFSGLFREALGDLLLEDGKLRLLVIDAEQEVIERWIPSTPGATPSNVS